MEEGADATPPSLNRAGGERWPFQIARGLGRAVNRGSATDGSLKAPSGFLGGSSGFG